MPELPEVEALRRDLSPGLIGRAIVRSDITKPKMLVTLDGLELSGIHDRPIQTLSRRAKMLIVRFDRGVSLVVHLKLAGQLVHRDGDRVIAAGGHPIPRFDAPFPHRSTHGRFDLDDGTILWFTDIRQFGRVTVLDSTSVDGFLASKKLGLEPFDASFTPAALGASLRRHRALPIKSALLDQANLAGLGNIYADEALHGSGIHPLWPAGGLDDDQLVRLHRAIVESLTYAITNGVADLPAGKVRPDSDFPRAHGRRGLPCLVCQTTMVRITVGARSTDYCPTCQPRPD
ncbi:MAG: formamidopyrimidine-DNA glycosylase [Chloroflexota bacterium]|nr:MAG: formamidopyrimidine-DNA glycosylase [Chloroflexota bacterium]